MVTNSQLCNAEGKSQAKARTDSSAEATETFKELFLGACPKYLFVNPPPYEDPALLQQYIENPPQDPTLRHVDLFLADVQALGGVVATRNLLKLYTSIDAAKLAAFSTSGEEGEEEVLQQLMVLKAASRTYARGNTAHSPSLLDGERITTNNLDFTIDGVSVLSHLKDSSLRMQSMVHVEETTSHRRFAGFFIR